MMKEVFHGIPRDVVHLGKMPPRPDAGTRIDELLVRLLLPHCVFGAGIAEDDPSEATAVRLREVL
jgi:hypothetical protein